MRRLVLALGLVTALAARSAASSASTEAGQATNAAKKCKKTSKKKCKKKTTVALKDGDYTYKQGSVGSAPINTLTISGKGTKIRIRELFFSSGESPGGLSCAATTIDFGTLALTRTGNLLTWSSGAKRVAVPPIQTEGAGGGTGTTSGEINVETLAVYVSTNVVMKNASGRNGSGCLEGHTYEGVQKLKRK